MLTYRQFQIALAALFLCLALAACKHAPANQTSPGDDSLDRLVRSLGGQRRLDNIRYLRLAITKRLDDGTQTTRSYWLDRRRDLCRIEGVRGKTGSHISAVVNLKTKEGSALVGYRANATQDPALINELAAEAILDTDWLLGFSRANDPGARVQSAGLQNVANQQSPTLNIELPGPPSRRYQMHLTPDGAKMLAWTVVPGVPSRRPSPYLVTQWYEVRGFSLPVRFERIRGPGPRTVTIDKIFAPGSIDDYIFLKP